jgi:transcriptional regulator with XRE-family HTH domain
MAKKIKRLETPDLGQPLTIELLGLAIKARRTQSNLRLEDAAALCGVAKQTLQRIEHGEATSHLDNVLRVCSSLGITLTIMPWHHEDEDSHEWY